MASKKNQLRKGDVVRLVRPVTNAQDLKVGAIGKVIAHRTEDDQYLVKWSLRSWPMRLGRWHIAKVQE